MHGQLPFSPRQQPSFATNNREFTHGRTPLTPLGFLPLIIRLLAVIRALTPPGEYQRLPLQPPTHPLASRCNRPQTRLDNSTPPHLQPTTLPTPAPVPPLPAVVSQKPHNPRYYPPARHTTLMSSLSRLSVIIGAGDKERDPIRSSRS
ncbi:hypothetical protein BJ508DRAFT_324784 [Ascobolus immersus RN42]|uniref:Uncharacterized protein n=1 Tax=Ascobolus immersus RN42 TaxID=1160509 RepID=A0A3N4ICJ6_ASCIM|nr:hypothetical protein BJ508DRAFT_324784 [Ascobolus immersus RN42]